MEIYSARRAPITPASSTRGRSRWPQHERGRHQDKAYATANICLRGLPQRTTEERKRMVYLVMDGEQVRSLREEQGMSQRRLAEASGVSRKTLADVEAGKVN